MVSEGGFERPLSVPRCRPGIRSGDVKESRVTQSHKIRYERADTRAVRMCVGLGVFGLARDEDGHPEIGSFEHFTRAVRRSEGEDTGQVVLEQLAQRAVELVDVTHVQRDDIQEVAGLARGSRCALNDQTRSILVDLVGERADSCRTPGYQCPRSHVRAIAQSLERLLDFRLCVKREHATLIKNVTGSSNLRIATKTRVEDLPTLCKTLLDLYRSEDYKHLFQRCRM